MKSKEITITKDKELRISSVELTEIINEFRKLESESTGKEFINLEHKDFMKKIRKEVSALKSLGIIGEGNFSQSSYINSQNKEQPCYSLNRDGMLQMLNSESVLVRYKTIEYINKIEEENKRLQEGQVLTLANQEIAELKETVKEFRIATEEAKKQFKPSHKRKIDYNKLIKSLTSSKEEEQTVKDWVFGLLNISKWEDICIDDTQKILKTITTVAGVLAVKRFEQLSLIEEEWD